MAAEDQTGGHRSSDDIEVGRTGARFGGAAGRRRRAEPAQDEETSRRHRGDGPSVGEAGARMPPVGKRWRTRKESAEPVESPPPTLDDSAPGDESKTGDAPKITGVAPAPHREQPARPPESPSPPGERSWVDGAAWVDSAEWVDWSDWEAVRDGDGLVRPYFWTGGRTASRFELSFETLISATGQSLDPTAPPEHGTILTLCGAPRSVAELAAMLSMPLGVARVVLGDMAEAGKVAVHRTAGSADAMLDLDLMQRVLNGLQRL